MAELFLIYQIYQVIKNAKAITDDVRNNEKPKFKDIALLVFSTVGITDVDVGIDFLTSIPWLNETFEGLVDAIFSEQVAETFSIDEERMKELEETVKNYLKEQIEEAPYNELKKVILIVAEKYDNRNAGDASGTKNILVSTQKVLKEMRGRMDRLEIKETILTESSLGDDEGKRGDMEKALFETLWAAYSVDRTLQDSLPEPPSADSDDEEVQKELKKEEVQKELKKVWHKSLIISAAVLIVDEAIKAHKMKKKGQEMAEDLRAQVVADRQQTEKETAKKDVSIEKLVDAPMIEEEETEEKMRTAAGSWNWNPWSRTEEEPAKMNTQSADAVDISNVDEKPQDSHRTFEDYFKQRAFVERAKKILKDAVDTIIDEEEKNILADSNKEEEKNITDSNKEEEKNITDSNKEEEKNIADSIVLKRFSDVLEEGLNSATDDSTVALSPMVDAILLAMVKMMYLANLVDHDSKIEQILRKSWKKEIMVERLIVTLEKDIFSTGNKYTSDTVVPAPPGLIEQSDADDKKKELQRLWLRFCTIATAEFISHMKDTEKRLEEYKAAYKRSECFICYNPMQSETACVLVDRSSKKRVCKHIYHHACAQKKKLLSKGPDPHCILCNETYPSTLLEEIPDFEENPEDWFNIADLNNDGKLSLEEVISILEPTVPINWAKAEPWLKNEWKTWTKNDDNELSLEEIKYELLPRLQRQKQNFPASKNESPPELGHKTLEEWFKYCDVDGSKNLDIAEVIRAVIKTRKAEKDSEMQRNIRTAVYEVWEAKGLYKDDKVTLKAFLSKDGLGEALLAKAEISPGIIDLNDTEFDDSSPRKKSCSFWKYLICTPCRSGKL